MDESPVLACDLTAIPPDERERHAEVTRRLFAATIEAREEPAGFAFRLPPEPALLLLAAEFVARESRCCPFFGFGIELAPAGGPLWLRLSGGAEVKAFARAEFGSLLPAERSGDA
jgi:hypothetical protein